MSRRGIDIKMFSGEVVKKAANDIKRYDKEMQGKIRNVIAKGTIAVMKAAIIKAPMGPTGSLKAGIHSEMEREKPQGIVKSDAPHSHLVEFGTVERIASNDPRKGKKAMRINDKFVSGVIRTGKMPKRPFMRPAMMQERGKIENEMEKIFQ